MDNDQEPTTTTTELPLKGKGVEIPRIPHLDNLAEDYRVHRDRRIGQLTKELAAKAKLVDALHEHADQLEQPDGCLAYRYGDICVTLEPGKEKLKVEDVSDEET